MAQNPQVTIIIVSFNTARLTLSCIESIKKYVKCLCEIIVVDNASGDKTVSEIKKSKLGVKIIENKNNLGFAKANNQGIKVARGKYVLLLNSDTLLIEDSITPVVEFMDANKEVGIASCKLLNKDRTVQPTGGYFPTRPRVFEWMFGIDDLPIISTTVRPLHPKTNFYDHDRELDWVTGAFFMVRRDIFEKVGVLDEDYFMYVEEMDFCYRAKGKGYKVFFLNTPKIIHFGRASAPSTFAIENELKNQVLFFRKHKSKSELLFVRWVFKLGSLFRGVLYAILGRENERKVYFKLAFEI